MNLEAIISASEKELFPSRGHAGAIAVDLLVKKPVEGALDAIAPGRAERSAEREKREISQKLEKLQLAKELREKLYPRLPPSVGTFEERSIDHPYATPDHTYTAVPYDGTEIALLQLPPIVFATDENERDLYISDFVYMLMAFRGRRTRLFSEGIPGVTFAFDSAIREDPNWRFIQWTNIVALGRAKLDFWKAFSLPMPTPVPARAQVCTKSLGDAEFKRIVDVLARFATYDKPSVGSAFSTLVSESNWPDVWKNMRRTGWTGNAPTDAATFVNYMVGKETFPTGHGHDLAGRSVLGEFLRTILKSGALGGNDADTLARIVVECALVSDVDTFKEYYIS